VGVYPQLPQGQAAPPSGGKKGYDMSSAMGKLSISSFKTQGTVKPVGNFDAENDAKILRKAMKGLGTDEKAIIDVLGYRSNEQRQEITKMFKTCFGKDLIKELKSELSRNFENVVLALMKKAEDYDAEELHKAMEGLGTDENTLIEIMCTRTNSQIQAIKAAYKTRYKKELEKDLIGDTSGHFRRLMVSLCQANRMESQDPSIEKAQMAAKELYEAGEGRWGTDESTFNRILCTQSHAQLALTCDEYQKLSKKQMEQVVKAEFSGDIQDGMLAVVKAAKNTPAYFAEKLYHSMKGAGTNDRTLIRVVVTRCEVDMVQIKEEFKKKYNQSLEAFIKDDCSGDYKRMLLALVQG
jgi:hypothetical protein